MRSPAGANEWARNNPRPREGGSWSGMCQSLMFRSCDLSQSRDTARLARLASNVVSLNPAAAPIGAFHWWDIPGSNEGHVGLEVGGAGSAVLMASTRVTNSYGAAIGLISADNYTLSGATYKGWSMDNCGQVLPGGGGSGGGGRSSFTKEEGIVCQRYARAGGYTGPIDGAPGEKTFIGLQTRLKNAGLYGGPIDGAPGENTWKALQTDARRGGYTGPIDGAPGPKTWAAIDIINGQEGQNGGGAQPPATDSIPAEAQLAMQKAGQASGGYNGPLDSAMGKNSWAGWQNVLKGCSLYSGPSDGVPGAETYKGTQEFGRRFGGYTGPSDGVPGAKTWEAIIKGVPPFLAGNTTPTPPPVTTPGVIARPAVGCVGNDVATMQANMDFAKAKAQGSQFIIAKASGLNVMPQYVAPHYKSQIDRAKAAGFERIGHYYLIGKGQTPEQQAEYFVKNLYKFDVKRDVLMLDNESLDSNGDFWNDASVNRWIAKVIELTGINVGRIWVYAGANDWRSHAPWNLTVATGARIVWAAYGSGPNSFVPDHVPELRGSVPRYDVHQSTSSLTIGDIERVDGLYSPLGMDKLFADVAGTVVVPPVVVEPPVVVPPVVVVVDRAPQLIKEIDEVLKRFR